MRTLNLIFFLTILIFISTASHAATVNARITGKVLSWDNAIPISGGFSGSQRYKLSTSSSFSTLAPANSWIPGIIQDTGLDTVKTITLNGPSGSITAPIEVVGVVYDTGGRAIGSGSSDLGNQFSSFTGCNVVLSGSTVRVTKSTTNGTLKCVGQKYDAGGKTPFLFLTSVFDVNEAKFIQAFKDNKAIEGSYSGFITLNIRYYYIQTNGQLTFRNIPQQLAIQVYYIPDYLEDVALSPSMLVIDPDYSVKGKVSGVAEDVSVSVTGFFTKGLQMTFTAGAGSAFQMAGPDNKVIKYFIKCTQCDQNTIVSNGSLHADVTGNNGLVTVPVGSNANKIDFKLSVGYDSQDYDDVSTGNYTGSFIVIFRVDL